MKKNFTKEEFYNSAGCWKKEQPENLNKLIENISKENSINFKDVLNSPLVSLKDKSWWIRESCNLILKQKQLFALESAKSVAYLYNNKYPNDKRISLCINITARYLKGLVSLNVLIKYKKNAADTAVYAADTAAYAVYAAVNAAAYAVDTAANAVDAAAYAAAYAAANDPVNAPVNATNKLIKSWIKILNTFE
jgi:hypothetical protein